MAAVSWKSAVSADWTVAADWSTGTVPAAGDDVTIGVAGSYTVTLTTAITVNSITLSDTSATVAITAPGVTDAVTSSLSNSGTLDVDATGTGGSKLAIGGTLSNQGNLYIGNTSLTSVTTVSASAVANSTFIDLVSGTASAILNVAGAFGNTNTVYVDASGGGGSSLTIGKRLTNSSTFNIGNTSLARAATVSAAAVSNYGNLYLYSGTASATMKITGAFGNTAGVAVDASGGGGSSLTIGGTLTNSGTLTIGNTSLAKATTVTAASLVNTGTINMNEGTAATATLYVTGAAPTTLSGTYTLAGAALVKFGSGGVTAIGSGSQLTLNGSKALMALSSAPSTNSALSGLASNVGVLILENGAALATSLVDLSNSYYIEVDLAGNGGSHLSIGGTLINENNLYVGNTGLTVATAVSAAALSNYGSITLASGTAAASLKLTGGFANGHNGSVAIDNNGAGGSIMTVGTTLTNNGTFTIGSANLGRATTVMAAALANAGTINMNEGTVATATLNITGAAPTTLSGTYTLSGAALVKFGSGGVTAIGSGAQLTLNGAKALMALSAAPTTNSALTGLAGNAGTLIQENGAKLTTGGDLANSYYVEVDLAGSGGSSLAVGGTLTNEYYLYIGNTALTVATTVSAAALNNYGTLNLSSGTAVAALKVAGGFVNTATVNVDNGGAGGSSLTIGGTLTNSGTLTIGSASLARATTVTAASLANTGTISMNEGTAATATLYITGAAPTTLSGTYQLSGAALMKFASGGVTAIGGGAQLTLNGGKALMALSSALSTNSALTGLASNAGTLILENGAALATTAVGLDNSYYVEVDLAGSGGSSLKIGGTLTNENYLYIGNTGLTVASTVSAAALSNYGSVNLYSGTAAATLKVTGGFANGRNGGVALDSSGGGGSSLTIGGTLINNGTLSIGNTNLATPTTVTAAGLANAGTINLSGGATAKATLAITGPTGSNSGAMNIGAFGAINAAGKIYTQSLGATTLAANATLTAATINVTGGVLQGAGTVTGKIVNTGGSVAGGTYTSNAPGILTVTGSYSQSDPGILQEVLTGTGAGQQSKLAVSGAANIQGGTLNADVFFALAAGEIFTVMSFAPGTLPGMFGTIEDGAFAGDGAFVAIGGGLTLGALYNVAAGNIQLQVLTTPASMTDLWVGGAGNWSTAADWTAGVPTSDSDVTIGQTGSGTVTLDIGDTIDSLTIRSGDTLGFAVNEALVVGGDVTVLSGGTLNMAGGDGLEVGGVLSDAGHMTVGAGATAELFSTPVNVTGTLTVAGTIKTAGATAVTMGSSIDRLILDPGFSFVGLVQGGGVNSTLELAAGAAAHVLNALGTEFTNFGTVTVDAGATWTVDALAAALSGVTITGSGGTNTLVITSPGAADLSHVSGFPTINLATGGNVVTVADKTLSGGAVVINHGASGNNSVSAAGDTSLSTGKTLTYVAGAGTDSFTGGFEKDVVKVTAAVVGGDTLTGGRAANTLTLTTASTFSLATVSKFGTINLAVGINTVTVADGTLSGGAITINAGASGNNSISAASDTSASTGKTLTYVAAAGSDTFTGGFENDTIQVGSGAGTYTAGSGTDFFVFTQSNLPLQTLNNYQIAHDNIVFYGLFAANGFDLGTADNALNPSTYTAVTASIFTSNATGTFDSTSQRFAYDTANGDLFYSANGSGGTSKEIAVLAAAPGLTAANLFFLH